MSDRTFPPGLNTELYYSHGLYGLVFLDKSGSNVCKIPRSVNDRPAIEVEKRIYERLTEDYQHSGLLRYRGSDPFDDGTAWAIHLERACNGQLSKFLKDEFSCVGVDLQIRWARQLADTLRYVHSKHVVHGDISCNNIFLDEHLNARLGDFAGSSIDGSEFLVTCSVSHEPPWSSTPEKADIFALGSVYYQIMTGAPPYHELSSDIIEARYKDGDFPKLESLETLGYIIEGCWHGRYHCLDAVIGDIDAEGIYVLKFLFKVFD